MALWGPKPVETIMVVLYIVAAVAIGVVLVAESVYTAVLSAKGE